MLLCEESRHMLWYSLVLAAELLLGAAAPPSSELFLCAQLLASDSADVRRSSPGGTVVMQLPSESVRAALLALKLQSDCVRSPFRNVSAASLPSEVPSDEWRAGRLPSRDEAE